MWTFAIFVLDNDAPTPLFDAVRPVPSLQPMTGSISDETILVVGKQGTITSFENTIAYRSFVPGEILGPRLTLPDQPFWKFFFDDIDQDGDEDVVVQTDLGPGWLEHEPTTQTLTLHEFPFDLELEQVADLDGDGIADLVLRGEDNFYMARALGNGNYDSPTALPAPFGFSTDPTLVSTGAPNRGTDILSLQRMGADFYENDGEGVFLTPVAVTFGQDIRAIESSVSLRDMNGDGHSDLVGHFLTPEQQDNGILAWAKNTGGETWDLQIILPNDTDEIRIFQAAVEDVDGDLDVDMIASTAEGLYLYLNDGSGQFQEPIFLSGGSAVKANNVTADINRDGHPDILSYGMEAAALWLPHSGITTPTPTSNYQDWAASQGVGGSLEDPDKDGNTNLEEFAFGLDPQMPDLYETGVRWIGGQLEVSWTSRVTGLTYQVEQSVDLIEWAPLTGETTLVPGGGGLQETRFMATSEVGNTFVRLRLTLTP